MMGALTHIGSHERTVLNCSDVVKNVVADETKNIGAVGMGTLGSPEMAENPETVRKVENVCNRSKTYMGDMVSVTGDKIEDENKLELEDSGEGSSKSNKDLVCVRKSRRMIGIELMWKI